MFYKRDGTPYQGPDSLLQWAKDCTKLNRIVSQQKLANGILVSTVWLGIDHGFGATRRPQIFETIVFAPDKAKMNFFGKDFEFHAALEMLRYATEEEALLGHKMMAKKWATFKTADQILDKKPFTS
jgi:hypothetical protein